MQLYYFDDLEEGLARETSHPFFVEHATADFYYSEGDDFAPFGNDTGHDLLRDLEGWYEDRRAGDKAETFLRKTLIRWEYGINYLLIKEPAQFSSINLEERWLTDSIDQAVIAIAFGQYKIAGKADKAMHKLAAEAFNRQCYLTEIAKTRINNPYDLADEYLSRIATMKADLAAMANKKAC